MTRQQQHARRFALVDCNSFFASCEKVFRPQLADKPVVVLSNNDGCVVARSPEAKQLGIPMGEPYFRIKHLAESGRVTVFSSNFELYGDMSRRIMSILSRWTPNLEVYSIDEAFLDMTGFDIPDLDEFMRNICHTVKKWTGVPVSVGMGPTKTLAKVANDAAKKGTCGWCGFFDEAERHAVLKAFDVGDVWGVGRRLVTRFRNLGLRTAFDLLSVDPYWMRKNFSVIQEKMVRELRGEVCFELDDDSAPRKNIQISRSFGEPVTEFEVLAEAVSTFASRGAEKLRAQNGVASAIYVHVNTNRFHEESYYTNSAVTGFSMPTDNTLEIVPAAIRTLRGIFSPNRNYKRAGILLMDIRDRDAALAQQTLFELDESRPKEKRENDQKLMQVLDQINRRMGRGSVFFGVEGTEKHWHSLATQKSRLFTTVLEDLPVAK